MTRSSTLAFLLILAADGIGLAQDQPAQVRTWTDRNGSTVEAAFIGIRDGRVGIRDTAGKEFFVAMDTLSTVDQTYVCDTLLEKAIGIHADGNSTHALKDIDDLLALNGDYHAAYLWKGEISLKLDDLETARRAYKHYATAVPNDVEGPRGVARTYEMEGNKDLAKFWYKKALDIDPDNEEVKSALAALDERRPMTPDDPFIDPTSDQANGSAAESAQTQSAPGGQKEMEQGDEAEEAKGFWHQGIVGVLGGRTVWWGRLIAIVVFGFGSLVAAVQAGMAGNRLSDEEVAAPASFFASIVGGAFSYVLYWGIPSGWAWLISACVVLAMAIIATAVAASDV